MYSVKINLIDTLTPKEKEVLDLLISGASNPEIGEALVIAIHTVKFHVANIYQKLGVRNRTEAAAYAANQGIAQQKPEPVAVDGCKAWTEAQIRAAAAQLVSLGLEDRKVVNAVVADLLLALEEKL